MPFTGAVTTGTHTTATPLANELVIDMSSQISQLEPDTSQFTTMIMKLQRERAKSFKVEWIDSEWLPPVMTLSACAASSDVAFTVSASDGKVVKAGNICRIVSTGEAFRVSGTPTSTSVTAGSRGLGSTASASAASGGDIVIIGHSDQQQASLPTILMINRATNYNYTQIQRDPYGLSRTSMQSEWYGGDLLDKERKAAGVVHKRALEHTSFFGPRFYTATGPEHGCGGLIEFVTTNISNAAGVFDKGELQTFLETGMQYGGDNKALYCAPRVSTVISNFLQDNWVRAGVNERVFGVKVDFVISGAFGAEVPVFVKREWGRYSKGTSNDYGSRAFLVDMDNVQWAPMQETVQLRNRQAPDFDGVKEEYLTEYSLKVRNERVHGLWTNITS